MADSTLRDEAESAQAANHPWLTNALSAGSAYRGPKAQTPDYDPATMGPILGQADPAAAKAWQASQEAGQVSPAQHQALVEAAGGAPKAAPVAKAAAAPAAALSQQEQLAKAFPGAYKPPEGYGPDGKPLTFLQKADTIEAGREAGMTEEEKSYRERQAMTQAGAAQYVKSTNEAQAEDARREGELKAHLALSDRDFQTREGLREAQNAKVRAMQVDPSKWFKDRGVAGSLLAALAMGAGAYAAAMPHAGSNVNQAGKIIDDAINRDVEAQRGDIENAWKDLDYQGKEDEKADVKNKFIHAQMGKAKLDTYDHAIALAQQQRQGITDQVAAKAYDDQIAQLVGKRADSKEELLKLHRTVAQQDLAASQAQANKDMESAVQLEKRYATYHDDWQKGKKEVPLLPKGEWLRQALGSGAEASAAAKAGKGLSPRLETKAIAAEEGAAAAETLRKLKPWSNNSWTTNPQAQSAMTSLKAAMDEAEPGVSHDALMSPLSPNHQGLVAAAKEKLTRRAAKIRANKGGEEEPERDERDAKERE